ncbi:MAG: peptidylprolyl isomerase [Planctomycetota bacterium JB042]
MQITKHTVATLEYTLKDGDGDVLDSTEEGKPISYVHGVGTLIPGLERALEGKGEGEALSVEIGPADAYGERNEQLVQPVPRTELPAEEEIVVGMQFEARSAQGSQVVTVVGVEEDRVVLDGNHPLAGVTLHFDVKVVATRPATPEEIEHGHVHDGREQH